MDKRKAYFGNADNRRKTFFETDKVRLGPTAIALSSFAPCSHTPVAFLASLAPLACHYVPFENAGRLAVDLNNNHKL